MLRKTLKLQSISTPWLKSSFLPALAQSSFYLSASSFNKSLHNSTPQYLFSNHHHNPHGVHGHGHHQHSSECSHNHTYTGPFEEKSFMNHFLHLSSHRSSSMKQEFFDLFKLLRENIDKIRNPNSAVALLHKVQLFDEYIDANLQKKILDQAIKNFSERYTVASDNGDLLRAAVLVVALQKLNNEHFFRTFFTILLNNVQSFSFSNLLTTLESFTYNKWLGQVANNDQTINVLNVLSSKLQVRELAFFAKYSNLLYYLVRNTFLDKNSAQSELMRGQIEKDVNKLYDVILQLIVNDRNSKTLDLFAMTDAYISLDVFNQIFPKLKGKHALLTKYYDTMVSAYLPKNFELGNVKYNLLTVTTFLKRYYVVPPQKVHPQFLSFINQVFLKHYNDREFRSLENYNYFLLFLVKTDGLKIPEKLREEVNIQDLILQERNLFVLAKTLEFFAFCEQANKNYFYHDKRELQTLEKVIFQIIGRLPKKTAPSPALLQIFQLLVALNRGDNEDWKNLLTIFNNKEGLNRLDYLELIIKLVPAGAVRTKTLYKVYSNITLSETSHNLKGVELDPELTQMLEKFWTNLEEILVEKANRIYADKWPIILFNFVYANIFKDNYKKLYQIAKPKLLGNLHQLDPKQLSEIVYSYSRVSEKADDLLFAVAKKVYDEKLHEKMSDVEVCNLYWGYANAGIWVEDLSTACEGRLFKVIKDLPIESYTQFCQALSINNKKLSPEEFDALNKYTIDLIEKLSKQKGGAVNIQNILGICNSFNILQNFGNKQVWESLLEFLLAKRDLYASNPLFMHYIYKLYIHLTVEGLRLAQKDALFEVIQGNYRGVVDYIKNNKKHIVSKFEKMVRTNIEQNLADLFGQGVQQRQGDEVITLHRGPSHDLLLVNDVTRIEDAIKQKKLPNLGARELLVPYTVDIFVGDYAIEVNGPLHYLRDEQGRLKENGYNALKRILLEKGNMKYIEVPYTLNANRSTEDAQEIYRYLKEKITELRK